MLKYKDQYWVRYELDKFKKKCEFTYIPCSRKKGTQIYRYSESKLGVYIQSTQIGKSIAKEYPALFKIETETSCEIVLLFDEVDLIKAANILKARKKVKRILTDDQRKQLSERMLTVRKTLIKTS